MIFANPVIKFILSMLLLMHQGPITPFPGISGGSSCSVVTHTHIQSATPTVTGTGVTATLVFPSAITAGDLVVVGDQNNGVPAMSSITLTSGDSGTWTAPPPPYYEAQDAVGVEFLYYIPSTGGGGTTLTLHAQGSGGFNFDRIVGDEWSGASCAVDVSAVLVGGTGTTATPSSMTTTNNGELIVQHIEVSGNNTITPGGSFVSGSTANNSTLAYWTQPTAGATAVAAGLSPSTAWGMAQVAFK